MIDKVYCIYKHTNLINGKVYIGQTCQKPEYRWGKNGDGYKSSPHFYSAIQHYGWNNFLHEVLFTNLSADEANTLEQYLISQYKANDPKFGYNSESGGKNHTPNEKTRELQSLSAQNKPIVTKETKQKLSAAAWHRKDSEETKLKKSIAAIKREQEKNGKRERPVICINTGEYFNSCRQAADWCGLVGVSGISSVCKNGKQKTAGVHPQTKEKLKWKYATEEEIIKYEICKN